jgi:putative DNA methylase
MDPFAGGGSIPLEAQRLGLVAYASDLNPVAVLINKAILELPPLWCNRPPVSMDPGGVKARSWIGSDGLAEDVRKYSGWVRDRAQKILGDFYPKADLADGSKAAVVAWIWARNVRCPNPACGIDAPLAHSWWLAKKPGKEAYVVASVADGRVHFSISHDMARSPSKDDHGTMRRGGAVCVGCGGSISLSYIRVEGEARRLGVQLVAIVAKGTGRRIYLAASEEHVACSRMDAPIEAPAEQLIHDPRNVWCVNYGLKSIADLFTNRQLVMLTTYCELIRQAREKIHMDAAAAGLSSESGLVGEASEARAYSDTVSVYLGLALSRVSSTNSGLCRWNPHPSKESVSDAFARQAIPMVWDFAEGNPFMPGPSDYRQSAEWIARALDALVVGKPGAASQADAAKVAKPLGTVLSTDPPYYDNVGYAVLSDFFYVWLRRVVGDLYPEMFQTSMTPKADELIADSSRHGGKAEAARFFRKKYEEVFTWLRNGAPDDLPVTIYYAYKQSESAGLGQVSTGWEVFLDAMLRTGWSIKATWPIRTERTGRMRDIGANALASSIILACRPRPETAARTDRRGFLRELRSELPPALVSLQQSNIPPVDLAQAAMGPGIAVFSKYAQVAEVDGSPMSVRTALSLINQVLGEVLAEHEGELDEDSRFALKWFAEHGWSDGAFGDAESMTKAFNTSIPRLERVGIFRARAGRARLILPSEISKKTGHSGDSTTVLWRILMDLVERVENEGLESGSELILAVMKAVPNIDAIRDMAYVLFSICERRRWSKDGVVFNHLVTSWPDLRKMA